MLLSPTRGRRSQITLRRSDYPKLDLTCGYALIISISKIFSQFVERWVLLKRSPFGYWNNVDNSLRFVCSCILSALPLILLHKIGVFNGSEGDWRRVATFGAVFAAHYFSERASHYEKWSYLANLYNEILKSKPFVLGGETNNPDMYSYKDTMTAALAHDIVTMEMWSSSSFYATFEKVLIDAIRYSKKQDLSKSVCIKIACGYTKAEALEVIEELQAYYLKREKKSYKDNIYLHRPA